MKRSCGDCQLCCKLLPVRSLAKEANTRCQHQRHRKGCAVYHRLTLVAPECRAWSCRWLVDSDAPELRRPDHVGYVVDLVPDVLKAISKADGTEHYVPVVQVWVDRPDAHRDPALRAYLERLQMPAIIRSSASEGFLLVPPSMTETGEWLEREGDTTAPSGSLMREAVDKGALSMRLGFSE